MLRRKFFNFIVLITISTYKRHLVRLADYYGRITISSNKCHLRLADYGQITAKFIHNLGYEMFCYFFEQKSMFRFQ